MSASCAAKIAVPRNCRSASTGSSLPHRRSSASRRARAAGAFLFLPRST
ncbi:hypothetical protein [Saccharothrix sp. NRRL B-16348]|nr:hypothetical protein [Saccharothrix sp. NRRL B-16348]